MRLLAGYARCYDGWAEWHSGIFHRRTTRLVLRVAAEGVGRVHSSTLLIMPSMTWEGLTPEICAATSVPYWIRSLVTEEGKPRRPH